MTYKYDKLDGRVESYDEDGALQSKGTYVEATDEPENLVVRAKKNHHLVGA